MKIDEHVTRAAYANQNKPESNLSDLARKTGSIIQRISTDVEGDLSAHKYTKGPAGDSLKGLFSK